MSDINSNMKSDLQVQHQHGRTDGRTDLEQLAQLSQVTAVDADARTDDIASIGDILKAWADAPRGRHDVIRTGERAEIPLHVRSAVFYRDRGRCELCGWLPVSGPWHLDHIKPWSAGGSDDTTNLRVLCEKHNLERSNFHEMHERPRPPATWWCLNCYDNEDFRWQYVGDMPACRLHGDHPIEPLFFWKRCPVTRGYRAHWEREQTWPTWHRRTPVRSGQLIAFCAHCGRPGPTDVVL